MEKKVIKLEDLKEGMKLRSLKNVCYVDEMSLEDGLLLEEELFERVNWVIKKDVYLVSYYDTGKISKKYKITLENGEKSMKIKTDAEGNFL